MINRRLIAVLLSLVMLVLVACSGTDSSGSAEADAKVETEEPKETEAPKETPVETEVPKETEAPKETPVETEATEEAKTEAVTEEADGIANPWTETTDSEEVMNALGFAFVPPNEAEGYLPEGYSFLTYRYMDDLCEAVYRKGDEEIVVRYSYEKNGTDLTGDYNEYSKEWLEEFNEPNVPSVALTCKGDGTTINCAFVPEDAAGLHYAFLCNPGQEGKGLTVDQIHKMLYGE